MSHFGPHLPESGLRFQFFFFSDQAEVSRSRPDYRINYRQLLRFVTDDPLVMTIGRLTIGFADTKKSMLKGNVTFLVRLSFFSVE